jgi:hypothetical protein
MHGACLLPFETCFFLLLSAERGSLVPQVKLWIYQFGLYMVCIVVCYGYVQWPEYFLEAIHKFQDQILQTGQEQESELRLKPSFPFDHPHSLVLFPRLV